MIRTNSIRTTVVITCDETGCTMCHVRDHTTAKKLETELLEARGWTRTAGRKHRCPNHPHLPAGSVLASAEPQRLGRAAQLRVRPEGERFVVSGGSAPHVVTPRGGQRFGCDCRDFAVRGGAICKHVLAVELSLATDEERAAVGRFLGVEAPAETPDDEQESSAQAWRPADYLRREAPPEGRVLRFDSERVFDQSPDDRPTIALICPNDGAPLRRNSRNLYECTTCGAGYTARDLVDGWLASVAVAAQPAA
jgi:hypothetical protein